MNGTSTVARELTAPAMLGLETRADFRRQAIELLEDLPEGEGRLTIDLGTTRQVDSSGLGALMLVQRRAAERRQSVVLRNPSDELRFLLTLTKLDDLFVVEGAGRAGRAERAERAERGRAPADAAGPDGGVDATRRGH